MEGKTKDGHELEIGSHYYNEYGEEIILESVLKDKGDGSTRYLVTPFFEGTTMTYSGAGGEHWDAECPYEHLGEPRVINAIFKEAPTFKVSRRLVAIGEACGVIKLAVDDLEKRREKVNEQVLSLSDSYRKLSNKNTEITDKINKKTSELDEVTAKVRQARQKLSELEDKTSQITPGCFGNAAISQDELAELRKRSFKLQCLEDGKVHNWEWHDDSLEPYFKRYPEG